LKCTAVSLIKSAYSLVAANVRYVASCSAWIINIPSTRPTRQQWDSNLESLAVRDTNPQHSSARNFLQSHA
jgi:hypothetical protein